jgi:hypothetical protein
MRGTGHDCFTRVWRRIGFVSRVLQAAMDWIFSTGYALPYTTKLKEQSHLLL